MKKLLLAVILFSTSLIGCIHTQYINPHGQEILIKKIEKLPVKAGLYIPDNLLNDTVAVDFGGQLNWIHTIYLVSGPALADAIYKAVSASVREVKVFHSLPYIDQGGNDSIALLIFPKFTKIDATIWLANDLPSIVETGLTLTFTRKNNEIIDTTFVTAIGVSAYDHDTSHAKDTIIINAADSAIASIQEQTIYSITENNVLRKALSFTLSSNNVIAPNPSSHGLYGWESKFEYDTTTKSLKPIPATRRWSVWCGYGINTDYPYDVTDYSIGVDLLLHSRFSVRTGLFVFNYYKSGDSYFSFAESRFITTASLVIINWGIFAQATYLFFGPTLFAETGVGLNTVFGTGFTGRINIPGLQRFQPSGIIGIRYQPIFARFGIDVNYTPYFDTKGIHNQISVSEGLVF